MLQAAGRTSFRRASIGIPQSLIIPHHGIVFQRALGDGVPQVARRRNTSRKVSSRGTSHRVCEEERRQSAQRQRATKTVTHTEEEKEDEDEDEDVIQWSELEKSSAGQHFENNHKTETLQEHLNSNQLSGAVDDVEEKERAEERIIGSNRTLEESFPRPNEPHFYEDREAPSDGQLLAAGNFFRHNKPKFAFSCSKFLEFPDSSVSEFCFIGRSNVGKSSLLNALFHTNFWKTQERKDLAIPGHRAGKTKTLNVFLAGNIDGGTKNVLHNGKMNPERWISTGRGIAIVDMPGYGFGSGFEQGQEIIKYLMNRKQLRRTFVLLNSDHGPTNLDREIFQMLEQAGISYQVVLTKVDKLWKAKPKPKMEPSKYALKKWFGLLREIKWKIKQWAHPPIWDILCVSAEKSLNGSSNNRHELVGMNGLRLAILEAAGLDQTNMPVVPSKSETRRRREKEVAKET